jgi:hypothetical protein
MNLSIFGTRVRQHISTAIQYMSNTAQNKPFISPVQNYKPKRQTILRMNAYLEVNSR